MSIAYLATEFAGDPPEPVARWYKLQTGTYARYCDGEVTIYHQADIKMQRSLEHTIEHVPGDGDPGEVEHVARAWRIHHGGAHQGHAGGGSSSGGGGPGAAFRQVL